MQNRDVCCLPGDITVTYIHRGFLIGRALKGTAENGPWWEYVKTVPTYEEAVNEAGRLASEAGTHAWLHVHHDVYRPIPVWTHGPDEQTG